MFVIYRDSGAGEEALPVLEVAPSVDDDVRRITNFKMHSKLRSFDVYMEDENTAKVTYNGKKSSF